VQSLEDSLADARAILAGLSIEAVVIGAVAALRYRATARATSDVDLLVDSIEGVREAFEQRGYQVDEVADPGGRPFLLAAQGDGVRIDIMLAETAYQVGALHRAQDGYLSPEDVIVHKLVAWRPRDRDDIESILAARETLDVAYIEKWAREWGVLERWARWDL
jgi:hypothetical protein